MIDVVATAAGPREDTETPQSSWQMLSRFPSLRIGGSYIFQPLFGAEGQLLAGGSRFYSRITLQTMHTGWFHKRGPHTSLAVAVSFCKKFGVSFMPVSEMKQPPNVSEKKYEVSKMHQGALAV